MEQIGVCAHRKHLLSDSAANCVTADLYKKVLLVGGTVSIAVGTYLPWLRIHPDLPSDAEIPTIYYTGMEAGFERFDFVLLGAVGLTLFVRVGSARTMARTATTLAVGLGAIVLPAYYLSQSTLIAFSGTFVPALGWYLTVLGGVLITVTGGLELPTTVRRPTVTTNPRE